MNTNADEIFNEALKLENHDARLGYVRDACKGNLELQHKIERLLAANENAADLIATEPGRALGIESVSEDAGTIIGRYKLLQRIGEGGMGAVFMAEQTEPVRRKVALKIIKLGMDTKSVVARFEAERQALALMEHPNIAKVLDAGATETGRPYFVMELVKGVPISDYCDKNRLATAERLKLFSQVCQAIQHAHQKGVIHRDIKPSNILVTLHDGEPVPKVIDFGIAKATNQRLTEKTLFTNFAQMIGTPAYMSPEQAEMSGLDIDTRTDVYSLGVLLYELLTGTTPFPEKELLSKGYGEMQRIIAEQEPDRPSLRMSTLIGEQQTVVSRNRAGELPLLTRQLRGDLDWIVMKALEKDRTRRYETANGLAQDIQRHLENEPVSAARPSLAYQLTKTIQRNKPAFAAGIAIAAMLILSTVIATVSAVRAQRAKDATQSLNDFVFHKLIGLANPETTSKRSLTLLDALDQIDESISDNFANRPELELEALLALGRAYLFRFDAERSAKFLKRAYELSRQEYGDHDLKTLVAGKNYLHSWIWSQHGPPQEAFETIVPRLFHHTTEQFKPDDPNYYLCHGIEAWRREHFHEGNPLDLLLETQPVHEQIRKVAPIQAALNLYSIGRFYGRQGNRTESEEYYRAALDEFIAEAGEVFPLTLLTRYYLAKSLSEKGETEEAIAELEVVLDKGKDVFQDQTFLTMASGKLLLAYMNAGQFEKAERLTQDISSDPASEYLAFPFLVLKHTEYPRHLSHEEAAANRAWENSLESLLALRPKVEQKSNEEPDPIDQARLLGIARIYRHLGEREEHYEILRQVPPTRHTLTMRAMNRAAAGDWSAAIKEVQSALNHTNPNDSPENKRYTRVIASLIDLHTKNIDGWATSCSRMLQEFGDAEKLTALRTALACLGQQERLPDELEQQAFKIAEAIYAEADSDDSPQTRTTRNVAGGLAAWRKGEYQQAIQRLDQWPYRSTTGKFEYRSDYERDRFRGEASQRLLMANCYARMKQFDKAEENLKRCDEIYAPITYDWWAPLLLASLRAETEALITAEK